MVKEYKARGLPLSGMLASLKKASPELLRSIVMIFDLKNDTWDWNTVNYISNIFSTGISSKQTHQQQL